MDLDISGVGGVAFISFQFSPLYASHGILIVFVGAARRLADKARLVVHHTTNFNFPAQMVLAGVAGKECVVCEQDLGIELTLDMVSAVW